MKLKHALSWYSLQQIQKRLNKKRFADLVVRVIDKLRLKRLFKPSLFVFSNKADLSNFQISLADMNRFVFPHPLNLSWLKLQVRY